MLAEDLADLMGKTPVAGCLRLLAKLLCLVPLARLLTGLLIKIETSAEQVSIQQTILDRGVPILSRVRDPRGPD
jgi:hypothetical protein